MDVFISRLHSVGGAKEGSFLPCHLMVEIRIKRYDSHYTSLRYFLNSSKGYHSPRDVNINIKITRSSPPPAHFSM